MNTEAATPQLNQRRRNTNNSAGDFTSPQITNCSQTSSTTSSLVVTTFRATDTSQTSGNDRVQVSAAPLISNVQPSLSTSKSTGSTAALETSKHSQSSGSDLIQGGVTHRVGNGSLTETTKLDTENATPPFDQRSQNLNKSAAGSPATQATVRQSVVGLAPPQVTSLPDEVTQPTKTPALPKTNRQPMSLNKTTKAPATSRAPQAQQTLVNKENNGTATPQVNQLSPNNSNTWIGGFGTSQVDHRLQETNKAAGGSGAHQAIKSTAVKVEASNGESGLGRHLTQSLPNPHAAQEEARWQARKSALLGLSRICEFRGCIPQWETRSSNEGWFATVIVSSTAYMAGPYRKAEWAKIVAAERALNALGSRAFQAQKQAQRRGSTYRPSHGKPNNNLAANVQQNQKSSNPTGPSSQGNMNQSQKATHQTARPAQEQQTAHLIPHPPQQVPINQHARPAQHESLPHPTFPSSHHDNLADVQLPDYARNNPIALQAFFEGLALGARMADVIIRSSREDERSRHHERSRSRSPLQASRSDNTRRYRERTPRVSEPLRDTYRSPSESRSRRRRYRGSCLPQEFWDRYHPASSDGANGRWEHDRYPYYDD